MKFPTLTPKIVLAIGAHADDIDYSASGSVAKWSSEGADVHYLVITDGSSGTSDQTMTKKQLIALREDEQRKAAKLLGACEDVYFLGYTDGELENTLALRKDIVRVIRTVRPDTVIVFDPTMVYVSEMGFINHPDHRAAGQATMDAIFPLARDHLSFPDLFTQEKLEPHKVGHLLLVNLEKSNYYVDISSHLHTKLSGLFAHGSQIDDTKSTTSMITDRALSAGGASGYTYAEGFMRVDLPT